MLLLVPVVEAVMNSPLIKENTHFSYSKGSSLPTPETLVLVMMGRTVMIESITATTAALLSPLATNLCTKTLTVHHCLHVRRDPGQY